ncbi:hypothetical protein ACLIBH_05810 [Virgibacillus sp. W0430]|uniref:hypothetical protein n=1 Tax=Virgibacillus sp. W0430 TaxID=3391580 RepID=UPI003F45BD3A
MYSPLPDKEAVQQDTMVNDQGKELPVVRMNLILERVIENTLYHYLKNEMKS